MRTEPDGTLHIMTEARKLANGLAKSRKAFLLFLLGVADAPIPSRLIKSGAMQTLAAEIYQLSELEFARCLETAMAAYTKEFQRIEAAEAGRLKSIKGSGAATRAYPKVAAKFPRAFEIIDKGLRKRK